MVISQNFMDNRSLVEEVYNFQKGIKNKNPILALSISNTFLPLLEYRRHLEQASKEDLLSLKGIGHSSVDYLLRIFKREDIESIVNDVPMVHKISTVVYNQYKPIETNSQSFYSDNAWDNAVKVYESL